MNVLLIFCCIEFWTLCRTEKGPISFRNLKGSILNNLFIGSLKSQKFKKKLKLLDNLL